MTDRGGRRVRRAIRSARNGVKSVPGPSTNPATNLMIADVTVRGLSFLFRRSLEKGLLRARFGPEKAKQIVEGKTMGHTLAGFAVSRLATRSVPGFLLVSGGLLGKAVLDRSLSRRESTRRGDETLEKIAENADDKEA
ncbi:hypothetical protein [Croceibacterium aestuarii]|uniref:hypothetical protein n=1 Tax=Croceibacterium aestuarii TaxID=3064139 RepID=UPI00272E2244|nr:hypothetical protein [Croceibacterium sp. D39]